MSRETRGAEEAAAQETVVAAMGGACECCQATEFLSVFLVRTNSDGQEQVMMGRPPQWTFLAHQDLATAPFKLLCGNCAVAMQTGPCPHTPVPASYV